MTKWATIGDLFDDDDPAVLRTRRAIEDAHRSRWEALQATESGETVQDDPPPPAAASTRRARVAALMELVRQGDRAAVELLREMLG